MNALTPLAVLAVLTSTSALAQDGCSLSDALEQRKASIDEVKVIEYPIPGFQAALLRSSEMRTQASSYNCKEKRQLTYPAFWAPVWVYEIPENARGELIDSERRVREAVERDESRSQLLANSL